MRGFLALLAVSLFVFPMVPASGGLETTTLYLHAVTGHADEVPAFLGLASPPTMDPTPPSGLVPKSSADTQVANHDSAENPLLAYWVGDVRGQLLAATATLYLASPLVSEVEASLFDSDGALVARSTVVGASPLTIDFAVNATITGKLVLQVGGFGPDGAILFDAVDQPSALTITTGPLAPPPPTSWTPTAGWGPVVAVSLGEAAREMSLVISPVDPQVMFACAPSGVPATGKGSSYFHVSRDGGATWSPIDVETSPDDTRTFAFEGGDCDVAFDQAGTMYTADTWLGDLSVGASRDGGATWTGTALAVSGPVVDRPWLVGGPDGTVHLIYQDVQFAMPAVIWYTKSTDHGLTWSTAIPIVTATQDGAQTWEGNLVVSPDQQKLAMVYTREPTHQGVQLTETVWVTRSINGGATWSSHKVATLNTSASYLYPTIGMDAAGGLHIAYTASSGTDRPVWYSQSPTGAFWSTPVKVQSGIATYAPWIEGGAPGEAVLQWYGSPTAGATERAPADWYFYGARIQNGTVVQSGPTTTTPIFSGNTTMAEFNQVRLDSAGKMNLGVASVRATGTTTAWTLYFQKEV